MKKFNGWWNNYEIILRKIVVVYEICTVRSHQKWMMKVKKRANIFCNQIWIGHQIKEKYIFEKPKQKYNNFVKCCMQCSGTCNYKKKCANIQHCQIITAQTQWDSMLMNKLWSFIIVRSNFFTTVKKIKMSGVSTDTHWERNDDGEIRVNVEIHIKNFNKVEDAH